MTNLLDKYDLMTAQQVREKDWTNDELDHLVACKVMGWKKIQFAGKPAWEIDKDRIRRPEDWHPSSDMNDAMTVAGEFAVDEDFSQCILGLGYKECRFQIFAKGERIGHATDETAPAQSA